MSLKREDRELCPSRIFNKVPEIIDPTEVKAVSFEEVIGSIRQVSGGSNAIQTARDIGICFGD